MQLAEGYRMTFWLMKRSSWVSKVEERHYTMKHWRTRDSNIFFGRFLRNGIWFRPFLFEKRWQERKDYIKSLFNVSSLHDIPYEIKVMYRTLSELSRYLCFIKDLDFFSSCEGANHTRLQIISLHRFDNCDTRCFCLYHLCGPLLCEINLMGRVMLAYWVCVKCMKVLGNECVCSGPYVLKSIRFDCSVFITGLKMISAILKVWLNLIFICMCVYVRALARALLSYI